MDNKVEEDQKEKINTMICYQLRANKHSFIPALVLSFKAKDGEELDFDDMNDLFSHFGDIEQLEIMKNTAMILFSNYFDAKCAKDYVNSNLNFASSFSEFNIRWFTPEDEKLLSREMQSKFGTLNLQRIVNEGQFLKRNAKDAPQIVKLATDVHYKYKYFADWTLSQTGKADFNKILAKQHKNFVFD